MKLKVQPLVLVLAAQMLVLAVAVVFMVVRSSSSHPAPRPPAHAAAEEEDEPTPLPHLKKLTPPPVPAPSGDGGEWAAFPDEKRQGHAAEPPPMPKPEPHGDEAHPGLAKHAPEPHAAEPHAAAPRAADPHAAAPRAVDPHAADPHAEPHAAVAEPPRAPPVLRTEAPTALTFESLVDQLVAGNARFAEGVTRQRDLTARRVATAAEERADAVVVTCTDSRVVPELLFDQPLGTFAVVRAPAAQVDDLAAKAVDDAVKRLGAKAVLVLGHVGCHHVDKALAAAPKKKAPRAATLTAALSGLSVVFEGEALEAAATELSVSFAAKELRKRSKVLSRADVAVLRLVYAPAAGTVRWLDAEQEAAAPPEPAPRVGRHP